MLTIFVCRWMGSEEKVFEIEIFIGHKSHGEVTISVSLQSRWSTLMAIASLWWIQIAFARTTHKRFDLTLAKERSLPNNQISWVEGKFGIGLPHPLVGCTHRVLYVYFILLLYYYLFLLHWHLDFLFLFCLHV
jgi:hypothetical protein